MKAKTKAEAIDKKEVIITKAKCKARCSSQEESLTGVYINSTIQHYLGKAYDAPTTEQALKVFELVYDEVSGETTISDDDMCYIVKKCMTQAGIDSGVSVTSNKTKSFETTSYGASVPNDDMSVGSKKKSFPSKRRF